MKTVNLKFTATAEFQDAEAAPGSPVASTLTISSVHNGVPYESAVAIQESATGALVQHIGTLNGMAKAKVEADKAKASAQ
jgi:hypothetical protein